MSLETDAYATLGVDPGAAADVISAAYRRLARMYHPDGRTQDSRRMIEINRAYDCIKTPELRRRYDEGSRFVGVGPGWVARESGRWVPGLGAHAAGGPGAAPSSWRARVDPVEARDSRPEWVRRAMTGKLRAKVVAG